MRNASLKFQMPRDGAAPSSAATKPAPSKLATALTLAAMSLGYGVVQLDVTIVNTALHAIGTSLGGGVRELQWVVSAYTIAFAAFILTAAARRDPARARSTFLSGASPVPPASRLSPRDPQAATL